MNNLRKILLPFSMLYALVMFIRNYAYQKGWIGSTSFSIPVVCVGNLSMGGTGKTPTIEYLIRLLSPNFQIATLSRGYGRKSKGYVEVEPYHHASQVGDEPLQFKRKFPMIRVAVDEQRASGIQRLMTHNSPEVILLDDAFQHRRVKPSYQILLTVYGDLYVDDWVLPAGNLREPTNGASRADVILVTKCPANLSKEEQQQISKRLKILPHQQLFFSTIAYEATVNSEKEELTLLELGDYTLVTGIANPSTLVAYLNKHKPPKKHLNFPDHHNFTKQELEFLSQEPCILTTEKDYVRLKNQLSTAQLYVLPIQMKLLADKERFEKLILHQITNVGGLQ